MKKKKKKRKKKARIEKLEPCGSHYYVPHRRGGGHIVFGADPVGVGVGVGISVTLSCLHDIS